VAGKLKKLFVVVFLTLIIWVWAFMSLERDTTLFGSLEVSPSTAPDYHVTFNGDKLKIGLKLTFRGAPPKIAALERRNRAPDTDPTRERLDFYYDPAEFGHTESKVYPIDVMDLVRKSSKIRELALTVVACEPANVETVEAHVQKLVRRELNVEVFDESGVSIATENIEPPRVSMYVQEDHPGSARVLLSVRQMENARIRAVRERPFVILGPDERRRYADQTVMIRLPSQMPLEAQVFQTNPSRIGFIMPQELVGAYHVELIDDIKTINFRSTPEAKILYQQQPYHLLIQVLSGDQNLEQTPPRPVIYNFPQETVRRGLIEAPDPPDQVRIRLIPVNPPAGP